MKCIEDFCTNEAKVRQRCQSHNWQFDHYGFCWPVHTKRPNLVLPNDGFSTDRFCPTCRQTKHWTQFHLELGMCAQCHRDALKPVVKQSLTTSEILAMLDKCMI